MIEVVLVEEVVIGPTDVELEDKDVVWVNEVELPTVEGV